MNGRLQIDYWDEFDWGMLVVWIIIVIMFLSAIALDPGHLRETIIFWIISVIPIFIIWRIGRYVYPSIPFLMVI